MAAGLNISIIQANLIWEDIPANLAMLEEKINTLTGRPEIVILPEMFSTGFTMRPTEFAETMEGSAISWMRRVAAEKRIILTGSLVIKEVQGGETKYFNRLLWMLPTGDYGYYDKRHRFGYAGEDREYQAGTKRLIASAKGWKINLLICYDLRFPIWSRQQQIPGAAAPEYDLLIYVANWPDKRIHAWRTLLQARAIENQCYVAGINRTGDDGNGIHYSGDSMIVDPLGEIILDAGNEETTATITLDKDHLGEVRERFPFWKDGDQFLIV